MVSERKRSRQIQINEFMKPCTILRTIYEKVHCSSYLVTMSLSDGSEETRFLQVFPEKYSHVCQRAETVQVRFFGREKIHSFNGFGGAEYILLNLPSDSLRWQRVLRKSLAQRLEILSQLGDYLKRSARQGIIPDGIDPRTLIWLDDGSLCNWDLQNVLFIEGASEEELRRRHRRCALDLTLLFIQILAGKAVKAENALTQLKLALYGKMSLSDQKELLELLEKYLSCEECTDLEPLLTALEWTIISAEDYVPKSTTDKDTCLAVANFLHKHPLWKYVRETPEGEKQLNVLIVGASPMRKAFLNAIIPCAQMLDTQMHIRIASGEADRFCDRYLKNAPLLGQMAQITHIPHRARRSYTLNESLTGKDRKGKTAPLVYLTFEKTAFPDAAAFRDAGCIFVLNPLTEPMWKKLVELDAAAQHPILFGLKEAVPQLEDPQKLGSLVELDSFSKTRGADLTKSVIYAKALAVHTFYEKEYEERISQSDILKGFQKPYNRNSSIRSALSIPYKLAAFGLADCEDSTDRFYNEVLRNEKRMRRLIWLEHRSWQAFLAIEGWMLDTENLEQDFAAHQYSHKSQGARWHACLFGSNDTERELLSEWSLEDWEQRNPAELDPLDRMSVILHRLYGKYVAETVEPALNANLNKLKTRLPSADWQQLKNAVSALQINGTNASVAWERVIKEIQKNLEQEKNGNIEVAKTILDAVKKQAEFIKKRNQCQQYKRLDRAILEAIPYLQEKDSIRCVYKLWADRDHPWNNMASAFFIEPKQVCLLTTEGQAEPDHQRMEVFLCDRRQIETSVKVLPLKELQKIQKGSVLDVTGVDIQQLLTATKHFAKIGANIPIIHYKNGKLRALDGNFPLLRCYRQNQTLTVEEMMIVTGAQVHSENEFVPMHQMLRYEELWQTIQTMDKYNTICDFLTECKQVWKVLPKQYRSYCKPWRLLYTKKEADEIGLLALLSSLKKACVIKPIQWDEQEVVATNPLCQESLNRMLDAYIGADVNGRKNLKLIYRSDDPEALCVLENLNLNFNSKFELRKGDDGKSMICFGREKNARNLQPSVLAQGLKKLQENGFIQQTNNKPFLQETTMPKRRKDGTEDTAQTVPAVQVRFHYADLPTMDCLTKAGNALEALAYHTIRQMDIFDDVKLGVSVLWGEQTLQGMPTQNEIDLVCTKGTKSYFISCKKRLQLFPEHITEIRYETDRFGVEGTAILLTTAREEDNTAAYARARHMGVEIITLKDKGDQRSAGVLRKKIREILKKTQS